MEQRFLKHVDKSDHPDGCWMWTAGKTPNGYGMFSLGSKKQGSRNAHRVAYEMWKGEIPNGMWVLHTCKNKCVNPDHLEAGSSRKNNKEDKVRDGTLLVGTKNPSAKYSEEQILDIRMRYAAGETQTSISKATGIKQGHISDICLRKLWTHI
jgi:hypothetical protein